MKEFKNVAPFVTNQINDLKKKTDTALDELLNNSSYFYNTGIASATVRNYLITDYGMITDSYQGLADILLDLSKHQPDLINNYIDNLENSLNKMFILKDYIKYLKNNSIPIIIADDTTEKQMREYLKVLKENDINVEGIDMQNNIEQKRNEQKYQIIENNHETYQIKIRKA